MTIEVPIRRGTARRLGLRRPSIPIWDEWRQDMIRKLLRFESHRPAVQLGRYTLGPAVQDEAWRMPFGPS